MFSWKFVNSQMLPLLACIVQPIKTDIAQKKRDCIPGHMRRTSHLSSQCRAALISKLVLVSQQVVHNKRTRSRRAALERLMVEPEGPGQLPIQLPGLYVLTHARLLPHKNSPPTHLDCIEVPKD